MFSVDQYPARTLSWWFGQRKNLDMSPTYQRRGGIWSRHDKAFLIDSILNDFDIPKLYIANFSYGSTPLNEKNMQFAVIDGKQRFEAIFEFFESKFPLERSFVYADDPKLPLAGLTYKDLRSNHPDVASKFENFNLSVMSVVTDDESTINELFVRLNTSKPLTGAEVRNAMQGVVPELIRDIASDPFFKTRVRFDVKRGQDLNAAAKLLLIEFRGRLVDTKKISLDRFVDEGIQAEAQTKNFERAALRVKETLDQMLEIFIERDPLLSSQGPVSLYYWMVREYGDEYGQQIRPFLVQFEAKRKKNRLAARKPETPPEEIDAELLLYDTLNRSVNDQGSLEGRYAIIDSRFQDF
jgi:hypothetical protein